MANPESQDDVRQSDQGIPEMEGSPRKSENDDRIRGGSDEEIRDVGEDDDDFDEADETDEDDVEEEDGV